jgi:hypothetical protein
LLGTKGYVVVVVVVVVNDEWLPVMTTQNMLHYLNAARSPNPDIPNTNRTLV